MKRWTFLIILILIVCCEDNIQLKVQTEINKTQIPAVVMGKVTKDGKMAGSNKLKHMVDSHIHLSVEQKDEDLKGCRVVETKKNRFGGCGHLVFLKLRKQGFAEVGRLSASGK